MMKYVGLFTLLCKFFIFLSMLIKSENLGDFPQLVC